MNRAVSGGNYNFLLPEHPNTRREEYTYRLDFAFTDKLRLYGRNNQINNNQTGYSDRSASRAALGVGRGLL